MSTKLLAIIILLFPKALFSQNKVVFQFVEYEWLADSSSNSSSNTSWFSYTRQFSTDSVFREKGLLTTDTSNSFKTTDLFKIKNNCWYVKTGRNWELFFNKGKTVFTILRINGYKIKPIWKQTQLHDDSSTIYQLDLKPIDINISSIPSYLFTAKDGIIAINGHDSFLIRSDKQHLKLNSNRD